MVFVNNISNNKLVMIHMYLLVHHKPYRLVLVDYLTHIFILVVDIHYVFHGIYFLILDLIGMLFAAIS